MGIYARRFLKYDQYFLRIRFLSIKDTVKRNRCTVAYLLKIYLLRDAFRAYWLNNAFNLITTTMKRVCIKYKFIIAIKIRVFKFLTITIIIIIISGVLKIHYRKSISIDIYFVRI